MINLADEVKSSTWVFEGTSGQLFYTLREELGMAENIVPINARFAQMTTYYAEDGYFRDDLPNVVVIFFDKKMVPIQGDEGWFSL